MNDLKKLRIAICNDHAGYFLKLAIIDYLKDIGVVTLKDFGCYSADSCDYADFAHPMANEISKGNFDFGISICGSGNGISMTQNKHNGIRAGLCWNADIVRLARQHNDANVLSLPARYLSTVDALLMVDVFIETPFEGGRHLKRVEKMDVIHD